MVSWGPFHRWLLKIWHWRCQQKQVNCYKNFIINKCINTEMIKYSYNFSFSLACSSKNLKASLRVWLLKDEILDFWFYGLSCFQKKRTIFQNFEINDFFFEKIWMGRWDNSVMVEKVNKNDRMMFNGYFGSFW